MSLPKEIIEYRAKKLAERKAEDAQNRELYGSIERFNIKEFNQSMKQVQSKGKKATRLTFARNRRWTDYNAPRKSDYKIKLEVSKELNKLYNGI